MRSKIIALATVLVAAMAVASGCGGGGSSSAEKTGNGTDRAFVADMVPHHKSAITMATIAQERAMTPFVKSLSAGIVRAQKSEIAAMQTADARLAKAGVKKGDLGVDHSMMGMSSDTGMLRTANPFDPAFLKMMLPHHEGALAMARAELKNGSDPELKKIATQIISGQQKEIAQMKQHLNQS